MQRIEAKYLILHTNYQRFLRLGGFWVLALLPCFNTGSSRLSAAEPQWAPTPAQNSEYPWNSKTLQFERPRLEVLWFPYSSEVSLLKCYRLCSALGHRKSLGGARASHPMIGQRSGCSLTTNISVQLRNWKNYEIPSLLLEHSVEMLPQRFFPWSTDRLLIRTWEFWLKLMESTYEAPGAVIWENKGPQWPMMKHRETHQCSIRRPLNTFPGVQWKCLVTGRYEQWVPALPRLGPRR